MTSLPWSSVEVRGGGGAGARMGTLVRQGARGAALPQPDPHPVRVLSGLLHALFLGARPENITRVCLAKQARFTLQAPTGRQTCHAGSHGVK